MHETLYRLVYISRNEIIGDDATIQSEIAQILQKSRENNLKADITGALMFNDGCFAQILEGSHENVQNTFERIQCDSRHSKVVLLAVEPTTERWFSNWSMAYSGLNTKASTKFSRIIQTSGFNPALLEGHQILELLNQHLLEAEKTA